MRKLTASAAERLSRIHNWEERGLLYWAARAMHCRDRVRTADSGTQLNRAVRDLEVAQEALRRYEGSKGVL